MKGEAIITAVFVVLVLVVFPVPDLLPLDETVELNPEVELCNETTGLFEVSELVFTLESVTRRTSILGWASERYDLEVGKVLKGDLEEEIVYLYVFPEGFYSMQFVPLTEGSSVTVFASMDSTHSSMEGFNTNEGKWSVYLHVQPCEAD